MGGEEMQLEGCIRVGHEAYQLLDDVHSKARGS